MLKRLTSIVLLGLSFSAWAVKIDVCLCLSKALQSACHYDLAAAKKIYSNFNDLSTREQLSFLLGDISQVVLKGGPDLWLSGLTFKMRADDVFSYFPRILALADGTTHFILDEEGELRRLSFQEPGAVAMAMTHPKQEIIRCDINLDEMQENKAWKILGLGNLQSIQLNHCKNFPFKDNFSDLIIMKSGLCACRSDFIGCGGVQVNDKSSLLHFFSEVSRVLNKDNKKSIAVLHGLIPNISISPKSTWIGDCLNKVSCLSFLFSSKKKIRSGDILDFMAENFKIIEETYPVEFEIILNPLGNINAVVIRPK